MPKNNSFEGNAGRDEPEDFYPKTFAHSPGAAAEATAVIEQVELAEWVKNSMKLLELESELTSFAEKLTEQQRVSIKTEQDILIARFYKKIENNRLYQRISAQLDRLPKSLEEYRASAKGKILKSIHLLLAGTNASWDEKAIKNFEAISQKTQELLLLQDMLLAPIKAWFEKELADMYYVLSRTVDHKIKAKAEELKNQAGLKDPDFRQN